MSKNHLTLYQRRWQAARRAAFERDKFRCTSCGRSGRLEAHHLVRLEDSGDPYALENLATRCRSCHIQEHRKTLSPDEKAWREMVEEIK